MKYLTLENFTPTVSTRARTDIMRLLAYMGNEEPAREPRRRELKPLEHVPIGVCSSPAAPCTVKEPISVITEDVRVGRWFPVFTVAPPDPSAINGSYFAYHHVLGKEVN